MIEELVAEGRAILVFSQFTAMLELLARDLEQQDIGYLMLTGQTRDRQAQVDAFQQGAAPVFLISLKAGGVGLNLTRADTVIHYDPWWNSTAEQQATDRAHRIGQDKPVFVYKLIAENTIEEKIATLQQRKALLSQHVNHQAQASGERFALELEELLTLLQQEATGKETPLPC
jgi:SNF2 family DNA or RNA helicase